MGGKLCSRGYIRIEGSHVMTLALTCPFFQIIILNSAVHIQVYRHSRGLL